MLVSLFSLPPLCPLWGLGLATLGVGLSTLEVDLSSDISKLLADCRSLILIVLVTGVVTFFGGDLTGEAPREATLDGEGDLVTSFSVACDKRWERRFFEPPVSPFLAGDRGRLLRVASVVPGINSSPQSCCSFIFLFFCKYPRDSGPLSSGGVTIHSSKGPGPSTEKS